MFNSDLTANRPTAGIVGRIFIATDSPYGIFRDNGTTWDQLAGMTGGGVTGSGTTGTITIWNGTSVVGNSSILEGVSLISTTKQFQSSKLITTGGTSSQFVKGDGTLDSTSYQPLITNPVTGTGTATQVAFWSSGTAISSDTNLYWDNTNKRLGIGISTPGAPLDIHSTGTNAQFNGTGTNNAQLIIQNAGVSKWSLGNIYSAGANYFRINDVVSSVERFTIQNTGSIAWNGYGLLTDTRTYSTGTIESFNAAKSLTIPNGATMSTGGTISSLLGSGNIALQGLITIPNSKTFATELLTGQISFNAAGSGLVMTQATGIRAATNEHSIAYFAGTNSGSIDYFSNKLIGGYYNQNTGTITPTITNAYQLLINDIGEYAHTFTFTNRWGIYQNGSSDNNYFASKVLIGSNVVSIYPLDVTGLARISGEGLISGLTIGKGTNGVAFNSALGIQALQGNTTGNWCTGVGYQTLQNNTSGNFNTGIGSNVLSAVGSNSHNTGAGFGTFQYLTSGSNNIAIGSQAGQKISGGSTNLTTSNNSIFIGFSAYPLADSQTNQIVIGNSAVGLGSNTTAIGNSSTTLTALYGTLITGGTSANASAQLQVDSTTKGFLQPRLTTAQKTAVSSPATGLEIYQTDGFQGKYVYVENEWLPISDNSELLWWSGNEGASTILNPLTTQATGTGAAVGYNTMNLVQTKTHSVSLTTGTTATGSSGVYTAQSTGMNNGTAGNKFCFRFVFVTPSALSNATDTYSITIGNGILPPGQPALNTFGFYYTHGTNAGAWTCFWNTIAGGSATSGVTLAVNTQYILEIEFILGTSIKYYINGSLVLTQSAGIPTALGAGYLSSASIVKSVGTTAVTGYCAAMFARKLI